MAAIALPVAEAVGARVQPGASPHRVQSARVTRLAGPPSRCGPIAAAPSDPIFVARRAPSRHRSVAATPSCRVRPPMTCQESTR